MNGLIRISMIAFGLAALACGGGSKSGATPAAPQKGAASDPESVFGPLEIGADWQSYTKVNSAPVRSSDHGGRFVDTYVNSVGLAAYKNESAEIPVGTIVVKTSWERDGEQPSTTPGPVFVMEKKASGYDAENGDWYYAIHWEKPVKGEPIYWRSPSPKVGYCFGCHNDYARQLGMVPDDMRAW